MQIIDVIVLHDAVTETPRIIQYREVSQVTRRVVASGASIKGVYIN